MNIYNLLVLLYAQFNEYNNEYNESTICCLVSIAPGRGAQQCDIFCDIRFYFGPKSLRTRYKWEIYICNYNLMYKESFCYLIGVY